MARKWVNCCRLTLPGIFSNKDLPVEDLGLVPWGWLSCLWHKGKKKKKITITFIERQFVFMFSKMIRSNISKVLFTDKNPTSQKVDLLAVKMARQWNSAGNYMYHGQVEGVPGWILNYIIFRQRKCLCPVNFPILNVRMLLLHFQSKKKCIQSYKPAYMMSYLYGDISWNFKFSWGRTLIITALFAKKNDYHDNS